MQMHLDDTTLDALVDGEIPAHRAAEVARHLEACAHCRDRADRLRRVMSSLAALPRSIHPDGDLLSGIRERMVPPESREEAARPLLPQPSRRAGGSTGALRWRLATAAVLVAVVSSALTVAVMRSGQRTSDGALAGPESSSPPTIVVASDPALARLSDLEAEYVRAAEELARAFGGRAPALDPETRALVDANLAAIDRAISEVRRALVAAPASEPLRLLLLASHERKLDFLRRASELTQ